MTGPTIEQTRGYDIMIWADEGGRILAQSFTILGEAILHGLSPGHRMGKEIEIIDPPSVFFSEVPKKTRIGLINPETNDAILVALGALHS